MKTRHEPDGTVTVTLDDGRRFSLMDGDGVLTIHSVESDLILRPLNSAAVEIDTPYE